MALTLAEKRQVQQRLLREREAAASLIEKAKKQTEILAAKVVDASDPVHMGAVDLGAFGVGLGLKAGIEWATDYLGKTFTQPGQYRRPNFYSAVASLGVGLAGYAGSLFLGYDPSADFPMHWFRSGSKQTSYTLMVLGAKEFGQWGGVWLETGHQAALDAAAAQRAQQMLAEQQQQQSPQK